MYIVILFGISLYIFSALPLAGLAFMVVTVEQALIVWHDNRAGTDAPTPARMKTTKRVIRWVFFVLLGLWMLSMFF